MASINVLLGGLFLFCMSIHAMGQCAETDVILKQRVTGNTVQGKPEYQVAIAMPIGCHCNVFVSLVCDGFQTIEPIPSDLIRHDPGNPAFCIVNNGLPLPPPPDVLSFFYAWDTQYNFYIGSTFTKCS